MAASAPGRVTVHQGNIGLVADCQRVVAEAKLAFYDLLFLVGQLLALGGILLVGIGVARQRARTLRALPASARFN